MRKRSKIFTVHLIHIFEIIVIILIILNICTEDIFWLNIILLGLLLLLFIKDFLACVKKSRRLGKINKNIKEGAKKGLTHLIHLQFQEDDVGEVAVLACNLNLLLQEIKKVFWDIKENLFNTKISKNTLDNIQILMISYIQKVVNIGNVRSQLESICGRINNATSSTKHILNSIIELANHTNREAAAIKETSGALGELLKSISVISLLTQDKQKMADELKKIAKIGKEKVVRTTDIISNINENTGEMLKIIEIINNIAESTNILSINAGIEAAHAGKKGKGFRVIADEIIKLVDSTKKNAGEISSLLKDQVNKMTLALNESEVSGEVLTNVNEEVQNAADTWIEISEKTIQMSQGTKTIQETTKNMFDITQAVFESSEAIKQSVERINNEATELDEAANKTLDILEKVTVTNEEAKSSTITILQQLNEITKFVNKLNNAIDFFNLGKRIFFLFTEENTDFYMKEILQHEFEIYKTNNHEKLFKMVKDFTNSIIIINLDNSPDNFDPDNYIKMVKKIPDSEKISIGLVSYKGQPEKDIHHKNCEYIFLKKNSPEMNARIFIEYIEKNRAKGLRRQVRVICSDKDNAQIRISFNNNQYVGTILDISSAALVTRFPENTPLKNLKNKFEFNLILMNRECTISGKSGIVKSDNEFLILFTEKIEKSVKDIIYNFIFKKLQEQLEYEMKNEK